MAPLFSTANVFMIFLSIVTALPEPQAQSRAVLPPIFFLAGDSTTHSGSGWGDGFINKTLLAPASGINYGADGTTLASFRSKGIWDTILSQIKAYKATNECIVTIQFGHNDQKNAKDEANYSANLKQYVVDVNTAGGVPIILTPITRRDFSGGMVIQNLATETAKALAVAANTGSRFIDLNKVSTAYVNVIGQKAAYAYNYNGTDKTHLNDWGSIVFGRMVSDLLVAKYADIKAYTVPNATMSALIAEGKPA